MARPIIKFREGVPKHIQDQLIRLWEIKVESYGKERDRKDAGFSTGNESTI